MAATMRFLARVTLGLVCLFTFSFLVFESMGLMDQDVITAKLDAAAARGAWLAALVVVGLLVADLFLPIPASIVMTLSGYLFGLAGAIWNFAGAMGAALLGFWLCRRFGRRAVHRLLERDQVAPMERFMDHYGAYAVLLSRAVPMATEVVSCLCGLSAMSGRRFALLSALGTLPLCALYAWAGAVAREPASAAAWWLALLIPAAGFALLGVFLRRRGTR